MSLSDFDLMLKERLPNWGRWGRQDCGRPDPEAGCGSIYQLGRADRDGDGEEAPEPPIVIDHIDADHLDKLIIRLSRPHRNAVRDRFYKRELLIPTELLHQAVRMLLDMEHGPYKEAA